MKKIFIDILCLFSIIIPIPCLSVNLVDSMKVNFKQSHFDIDRNYEYNGKRIDSLLNLISSDSIWLHLKSVEVRGSASPEGSIQFNRYLSEKRAHAIFEIFNKSNLVNDSMVSFTFLGRDWEGLKDQVINDMNTPHRDEVIRFIENINQENCDSRTADPVIALKSLYGGKPYKYMYDNFFPNLRFSQIILEYDAEYPQLISSQPELLSIDPKSATDICLPSLHIQTDSGTVCEHRSLYVDIKTNLLYDVALLPNVGAEFFIGRNWSLTADWMYGWWDRDKSHYYWRAYGGWIGLRRWFGRRAAEKPLTGHHIGLFAGAVTYDFELGKGGIMGGIPHGTLWDRCNFISGIEYGYSLPISRRLNIDFSIAIGYIGGKYLKYSPKDGFYMWQSTHKINWFGPTKAEVSLVWLLGHDNYNRKKRE